MFVCYSLFFLKVLQDYKQQKEQDNLWKELLLRIAGDTEEEKGKNMNLIYTEEFFERSKCIATISAPSRRELKVSIEQLQRRQALPAFCDVVYNREIQVGKNPAKDVLEMRHMTGLSQTAFAKRYDLNQRTLRSWEAGERGCSKNMRQLLCFRVLADRDDGLLPLELAV